MFSGSGPDCRDFARGKNASILDSIGTDLLQKEQEGNFVQRQDDKVDKDVGQGSRWKRYAEPDSSDSE